MSMNGIQPMEDTKMAYPMLKPCLQCGQTKDLYIEQTVFSSSMYCKRCYDLGAMASMGDTPIDAMNDWNQMVEDAIDAELDSIVEATR